MKILQFLNVLVNVVAFLRVFWFPPTGNSEKMVGFVNSLVCKQSSADLDLFLCKISHVSPLEINAYKLFNARYLSYHVPLKKKPGII